MKKILLTFVALAGLTLSANAQAPRLSLLEEFTGENCDPCARYNPAYWALIEDSGTNTSKVLNITYMEPIPSSGWFYLQDKTTSDTRIQYYQTFFNTATGQTGSEFTPSDVQDGHYTDGSTANPMNIASFKQADIDSMHGVTSPFTISVTNSWDATYSNVITSITVTNASSTTTYAPASAAFMLRVALVQTIDFATPPGTNGESHFNHAVRAMYPDAGGTSISNSWAPGATQTYTMSCACPSYVDKSQSPFMVAWIQNDHDLTVAQAAQGAPLAKLANDAAITTVTGPADLSCAANGSLAVTHTVTINNRGTGTLTQATIYYSVDGATLQSIPWVGSLASGASTNFSISSANVTIAGALYHSLYDSLGLPNGVGSENTDNTAASTSFFVESTNGLAMPFKTAFSTNAGEYYQSRAADGSGWAIYNEGTTYTFADSLSDAAMFAAYGFPANDVSVITLPEIVTSSPSAVDFWEAYAQYSSAYTDMLEVVYSSDCGGTWNSLWSASGAALATAATTTVQFIPTSTSQYVEHSVSLNTVPSGSIIGFRATSGYGNDIWLGKVYVRAGAPIPSLVGQVSAVTATSIYPNPAKDEATLSFSLENASNVQVQVVDQLGRTVSEVANEPMSIGAHTLTINTASLANGIYNVVMRTDGGIATQRLSVIK